MNPADLLEHCLRFEHSYVDTPFGEQTLVVKIAGKAFAFIPLDEERPQISLKALPETVLELLDRYEDATQPPYLNKKHWVRLYCDGVIPKSTVVDSIATSYQLVVAGLPKAVRQPLGL